MPREIKFRCWDGKRYFYCPLNGTVGELLPIVFDGASYRLNLIGGRLSGPVEVEQFTGLKDKNGRDIYEGDIVKPVGGYELDECDDAAKVYWNNDAAAWYAMCNCDEFPLAEFDLDKVIGNVHVSPELLT